MLKKCDLSTFQLSYLDKVKARGNFQFREIRPVVLAILVDIQENGDVAVIKYSEKFDNIQLQKNQLRVTPEEIEFAYSQVPKDIISTLQEIIKNITIFHTAQKRDLWYVQSRQGISVGQLMRPIEKVGIYVPGGKAPYPSTVLMTVVPAKIAGVPEVILCTPPRADGTINPVILVAAEEAGIDAIYKVGGAQAIGAMAYGTETIPAVHKIIGPGNIYVTTAKLLVSTVIGIDLPAGPSEVLILADETSEPRFIAIDLVSQAEHDENAYCFLVTTSKTVIEEVEKELNRLVSTQSRFEIIKKSLNNNGYLILVDKMAEAIKLINEIAPEHLELQIKDPEGALPQINNAGAIFLGKFSPVPIGDYAAGTNHVLPTGGAAKIYSGLSIASFMKLIDVAKCSRAGLQTLAPWIATLAKIEGLDAHAQSIQMRLEK